MRIFKYPDLTAAKRQHLTSVTDETLISRNQTLYMSGLTHQTYQLNPTIMYSLNASYYKKEFHSIQALLQDIMESGMDPNYEITRDGEPTGEMAIDLMSF